jgi:hypothetical protein
VKAKRIGLLLQQCRVGLFGVETKAGGQTGTDDQYRFPSRRGPGNRGTGNRSLSAVSGSQFPVPGSRFCRVRSLPRSTRSTGA